MFQGRRKPSAHSAVTKIPINGTFALYFFSSLLSLLLPPCREEIQVPLADEGHRTSTNVEVNDSTVADPLSMPLPSFLPAPF